MARIVKTHYITLRVVFSAPVTRKEAFAALEATFKGREYFDNTRSAASAFKVVATIGVTRTAGIA